MIPILISLISFNLGFFRDCIKHQQLAMVMDRWQLLDITAARSLEKSCI
jgi:hypothetical protein